MDRRSVGVRFDTEPEEEDRVRAPAVGGTRRKEAGCCHWRSRAGLRPKKGGKKQAYCCTAIGFGLGPR